MLWSDCSGLVWSGLPESGLLRCSGLPVVWSGLMLWPGLGLCPPNFVRLVDDLVEIIILCWGLAVGLAPNLTNALDSLNWIDKLFLLGFGLGGGSLI